MNPEIEARAQQLLRTLVGLTVSDAASVLATAYCLLLNIVNRHCVVPPMQVGDTLESDLARLGIPRQGEPEPPTPGVVFAPPHGPVAGQGPAAAPLPPAGPSLQAEEA